MSGVDPTERPTDAAVLGPGPRRRTAPFAVGVAAVLLVALIAVLATRPGAGERQARSPLIGQVAPAVSGTTFDGGSVDIDRYRGRWVLVNFFAHWCIPCRQEHPELIEFVERHQGRGDAALISVVIETAEDKARRYFDEEGGDWPIVLDPEGRTSLHYGMVRVPETFVVAPSGIVVERLIGGVTADGLDRVIDAYERAATEAATEVAP